MRETLDDIHERKKILNTEKLIQKINNILETSEKVKKSGNDHEYVSILEELFSIVHKLPYEVKLSIRNQLLTTQLNLAISYYRTNDYNSAIKNLEDIIKLSSFYSNTLEIQYYVFHLLSHITLYIGVNEKKLDLINQAEKLIHEKFSRIDQLKDEVLKSRILDDRAILGAYKKNTLKTKVVLAFPTPILVDNNEIFKFIYGTTNCELVFTNIQIEENENFVELLYDKYGLANSTSVSLTMDRYFEHGIGAFDDHVKIRDFAIQVINHFIERYRIATDRYWVEYINQFWLTSYSFDITAGDISLRVCPMIDPRRYKVYSSKNPQLLNTKEMEVIKDLLTYTDISVWKSMLLLSKDFLLLQRYREAVFSINCAFENFIETELRRIIEKSLGMEESSNFFEGIVSYENYPLKKYINKQNFEEASKLGLIEKKVPSTFAIFKMCNKFVKTGISNVKLTKIISEIRANRNEVIHGREYDPSHGPLEKSVPNSITKFEELLKAFNVIEQES